MSDVRPEFICIGKTHDSITLTLRTDPPSLPPLPSLWSLEQQIYFLQKPVCVVGKRGYIGDMAWDVCHWMERIDGYYHVIICVRCNAENQSPLWSCEADIRLTICSPTGRNHVEELGRTFRKDEKYKYTIVKWTAYEMQRLVDLKKNIRDTVEITVNIMQRNVVGMCLPIDVPNFTVASELSDTVLIVEGKRLYVSKQYLSYHSPVFRTMLHGEFKDQEAITVPDVNYEEFYNFLEVLYPHGDVTDETLKSLLKLAERFQTPSVLDKCESFMKVYRCSTAYTYIDDTRGILQTVTKCDVSQMGKDELSALLRLEFVAKAINVGSHLKPSLLR